MYTRSKPNPIYKRKRKSIILFGKENLYNSIPYQFLTKENKMDGIQVKINS